MKTLENLEGQKCLFWLENDLGTVSFEASLHVSEKLNKLITLNELEAGQVYYNFDLSACEISLSDASPLRTDIAKIITIRSKIPLSHSSPNRAMKIEQFRQAVLA